MPSAKIDLAATGDLIAAPTTGFIRVHAFTLSADGAGLGRLADGAGAVYAGLASGASGNAVAASFTEIGEFDLPPQSKLQLVVAGGTPRFLGHVSYSIRGADLGV